MELKGSKTEINLRTAFTAESEVREKYTAYGKKAREEGLHQIANIFDETATNESAHGRIWYGLLGETQDTLKNLEKAAKGETYETTTMYPKFAEVAEEEGFSSIAKLFREIGSIEAMHAARYQKLYDHLNAGETFSRPESRRWVCQNCGYVHEGQSAPEVCPVCAHPKGAFEIEAQNF